MPFTVFHFIPDLHVGGILRLLYYNLKEFESKDIRNVVIYFNSNKDGEYLFKDTSVEVIRIPYKNIFSIPSVMKSLMKLTRERKPELLHSHLPFDAKFSLLLSIIKGIPLLITLHFVWDKSGGMMKGTFAERINRWVFNRSLKRAKGIVAVSQFVKDHFVEYTEKIEVIYSGVIDHSVNTSIKASLYSGNPKLLSVGRSHAVKGHAYFVDLILILKEKFPQIQLNIFTKKPGQSDYGKELLRRIKQENLESNIVFIEDINDPALLVTLFSEADCFVTPSLFESLGLSILEAFSFGVPVVASNVGGIPEIVKDDYTGYLFPVGDMKSAAARIEQILVNRQTTQEMKSNARLFFLNNFSINVATGKLFSFYKRVIGRNN